MYLGRDAAGSGNLVLAGAAQLSAEAEYVGYRGVGWLTQTAGANTVRDDLYLGYHNGSDGTYELGGTGQLEAENEHVGYVGTGRFAQTGGLNTVVYLFVGKGPGSHGTYEHTGGETKVTENLFIAVDVASEGTYLLGGTGQLNVRREERLGEHGTFVQTGGTNSAEKLIIMRAAPEGTYQLHGTGQLTAEYEWIGFGSAGASTPPSGTFVQTGGTNNVQRLSLGFDVGSEGTYELSETGVLQGYIEYVGHNGTGRLIQTGGTNNVDLALYVGYEIGGEGTYELSGGVLSCGEEIKTRGEYVGHRGRGLFIHSGGTNTFNKLQIGRTDEGVYQLSGTGRLVGERVIVGDVRYSGPGTFVYMGGEIDVDEFIVTSMGTFIHADGTTAYEAFGLNGRYELGGSGQLTTDNGYIGYDFGDNPAYAEDEATGVFLQTGGTYIVTNTLLLGSESGLNGVYSISAGSLSAGDLLIGSTGDGRLEITDAAGNVTVAERLLLGQAGSLLAVSGSRIHMTGSAFENHGTDPAPWADLANLTLLFEGGSNDVDPFEVGGEDMGPVGAGFEANFALGTLQLGGPAGVGRVELADSFDNRPDWEGSEALYLDQLVVGGGSSLELGGLNLYSRAVSIDAEGLLDVQGGTFSVLGNVELLLDGWIGTCLIDSELPPELHLDAAYNPAADCTTIRAIPEPATLLLVAAGVLCLLAWAWGKRRSH